MVMAIDLGNTSIKAGIFDATNLVFHAHVDHPHVPTIRFYQSWFKLMMDKYPIKRIILASVNPQIKHLIIKALALLTTLVPYLIQATSFPDFELRIDHPEELGVDLIVDAIATHHLYFQEAIIVDVGTATKVMAIQKQGFEGVAIAPGIVTSFKALNDQASLINTMKMVRPDRVFGKNTPAALASGIILGHVYMIEGLIRQGMQSLGWKYVSIVLTGGYAPKLMPYFSMKFTHDPHLSLKGINLCP